MWFIRFQRSSPYRFVNNIASPVHKKYKIQRLSDPKKNRESNTTKQIHIFMLIKSSSYRLFKLSSIQAIDYSSYR